MVAVGGLYGQADSYLRQFEGMRSQRVDFDVKWQMVSDYIRPRRNFTVMQRPNQLRPHKVTSSAATNASNRLVALLLAYMIDPTRPNLLPNVKSGLVAAGRDTDLDTGALDYLGKLEWSVFDRMMLPRAQLMVRLGSMLKEYVDFGCGVIWTGRRRGFGPYFNARPLQACWWTENEEGEIDTLYFRMMLPVYRVIQRWPEAGALPGWNQASDKKPDELALTPILLCCQPRPGGVRGAVRENKPFAMVTIAEEKNRVIETSGFDSFPYAVFRNDPLPGNAYAEGLGCQVLPDVMVLNHLQQAIENGASQKAEPAIAVPARMFGRTLDRRPSAVNAYNPAGLGLARADQAIIKLDFTGDIQEAVALKQSLINDIELGYYTDWLRLREAGDMTAEEVNERRDMRLRGMASIVANMELPMSLIGDRVQEAMMAEGLIAPPPASLAGINVDWEYAGPLATEQLRGNVRGALELLNALGIASQFDQGAVQTVNVEEVLRTIAEGLGTPTRSLNSRAYVAAAKAQIAEAQKQQANAQKLAMVAQAANDGAGAVSQLAGAAQQGGAGGPGGPPAPFAPAAPFNQPVAA